MTNLLGHRFLPALIYKKPVSIHPERDRVCSKEVFYLTDLKLKLDVEGVMLVSGISGLPIQHWHYQPAVRPENNVNHSSDFNITLDSNLLKLLISSISSGVSLKASNIYITLYSFTCRVLKCDLHLP